MLPALDRILALMIANTAIANAASPAVMMAHSTVEAPRSLRMSRLVVWAKARRHTHMYCISAMFVSFLCRQDVHGRRVANKNQEPEGHDDLCDAHIVIGLVRFGFGVGQLAS